MKLAERTFKRNDYYITSPFGNRIHPITGKPQFHNGCDYGTNVQNWKQYALENGYVVDNGNNPNGYGIWVGVGYPRLNIYILHAHLKESYVKAGDKVNSNTVIGLTGATGNVTGIHLHMGLVYNEKGNGNYADPEGYNYEEEIEMPFKVGDYIYAKEDVKLYTSIDYKENKYTIKKNEKAYIKYSKGNNIALADPNNKEYFPSAWTNSFDKFTKDEPGEDYKKKYEEELAKNEILITENNLLKNKIEKAINDLK